MNIWHRKAAPRKTAPGYCGTIRLVHLNSFYRDVTPDKVRAGLATFAKGGIEPRSLSSMTAGRIIVRFCPKASKPRVARRRQEFQRRLSSTVRIAKDEFK